MTEVKFGMITTNELGNKRQTHREKGKRGEENGESLIFRTNPIYLYFSSAFQ